MPIVLCLFIHNIGSKHDRETITSKLTFYATHITRITSSTETQGQSVGSGEKAGRKFSRKGGRAPGYRLSSNYFQTFKRLLAPDWAQKYFVLLCPIGEQFLLSSFREFVHDGYCLATLARFVHQASACKGNFYFILS